jgi:pimeloyl-ACP methyl ester carboxylesterase
MQASPPLADVVDIGGGRHLYVQCSGAGSPTLVFESGDESDTSSWVKVLPGVVASTRTCAYDRLGNGQSSAPLNPCRGLADLRGDFEAVLRAAAAQPPYVLVGASGGGLLVAGYAMAHPENVAGLVLVDTPRAVVLDDLPKAVRDEIRCGSPSNQEHRDFAAIEHEVWDHRRTVGDIPVTVVSNDYGNVSGLIPEQQTNVEDQRGWFVLSPSARQVVVTSGHDVPGNEATLLTGEILKVLQLARASCGRIAPRLVRDLTRGQHAPPQERPMPAVRWAHADTCPVREPSADWVSLSPRFTPGWPWHEDDPGRTPCHVWCRASPAPGLVIGLLLMAALVGCEEDMGTEDWLIVDNRTDSEVFITDAGTDLRNSLRGNETTGFDILGSIGAGSQGWGAGAVEQCDARALIAHGGSPDGPVVARRPKADGQACVKTWVIGPDD